jgi:hypothetical protein
LTLGLPGKLIAELKKFEKRIVWWFSKSLHGGRGFAKRTPEPNHDRTRPAHAAAANPNRKKRAHIPGSHPRSKNMTPHTPEDLSTKIAWSPFMIIGHTLPPRDPEDEDDEDEEDDSSDEPPVVREPDED